MQKELDQTAYGVSNREARTNLIKPRPVAAIFNDWRAASNAVDELHIAGFGDDRIGIARLNSDKLVRVDPTTGRVEETKTNGDVAAGVGAGAVVGGATGLLAALASLLIPGIGPVVAGGVLATTFGTAVGTAVAGTAIGAGVGAVAGGLIGALTSVGFSDEEARYYEIELKRGGTLVTLSPGTREREALDILERNGGRTTLV